MTKQNSNGSNGTGTEDPQTSLAPSGYGSKFNHQGTAGLVHVSIHQDSILVTYFFTHSQVDSVNLAVDQATTWANADFLYMVVGQDLR